MGIFLLNFDYKQSRNCPVCLIWSRYGSIAEYTKIKVKVKEEVKVHGMTVISCLSPG